MAIEQTKVKPLTMGEEAAALLRRGWTVFPLHTPDGRGGCSCRNVKCVNIGKHPRTRNGLKDASKDPAHVARWWSMWPEANIGLACGAISGLVIIDVDGAEGEDSFRGLEAELGPLPATVEALTGKGRHLYFNHPGGIVRPTAGILGPGVDVRGDGSYVVAPPSLHATGRRYTWEAEHHIEDIALADLPEAWAHRLRADKPRGKRPAEEAPIPEGQRNATLTSMAGTMRRRGLSEDAILQALLVENDKRCRPPLEAREVEAIAKSIARYDPAPEAVKPQVTPIAIYAGNDNLPEVTGQAWDAIKWANREDPSLFRRGGAPVRVEDDEQGNPVITVLNPDRMRYELARCAYWYTLKGKDGEEVPAKPPMYVVRDVLATPNYPLPVLERVVEVPVFSPDGKISLAPGYHEENRTYYKPKKGLTIPHIPDKPSKADIEKARGILLEELLVDFPFKTQADRANATALSLLPYVRDMIDGPTPFHLIEGPTPGTGKGLLASALLRPALGERFGMVPPADNEEEWRKRLTSTFRDGNPAFFLDNLTHFLDSGVLSAAITATTWMDRVLGETANITLPVKCIFGAAANNPGLSTEMARRAVRIRLDSKTEKPWERTDFRHELPAWSFENRGDIVWANLVLVKAWVEAGQPSGNSPVMGSFEQWSNVMGGVLEYAGIPEFLGNKDQLFDAVDSEMARWRAFVEMWGAKFGAEPVRVAELYDLAVECDFPLGKGDERAQRTSLGMQLNRARDRVFAGFQIVDAGHHRNAKLLKLVSVRI